VRTLRKTNPKSEMTRESSASVKFVGDDVACFIAQERFCDLQHLSCQGDHFFENPSKPGTVRVNENVMGGVSGKVTKTWKSRKMLGDQLMLVCFESSCFEHCFNTLTPSCSDVVETKILRARPQPSRPSPGSLRRMP